MADKKSRKADSKKDKVKDLKSKKVSGKKASQVKGGSFGLSMEGVSFDGIKSFEPLGPNDSILRAPAPLWTKGGGASVG